MRGEESQILIQLQFLLLVHGFSDRFFFSGIQHLAYLLRNPQAVSLSNVLIRSD